MSKNMKKHTKTTISTWRWKYYGRL